MSPDSAAKKGRSQASSPLAEHGIRPDLTGHWRTDSGLVVEVIGDNVIWYSELFINRHTESGLVVEVIIGIIWYSDIY